MCRIGFDSLGDAVLAKLAATGLRDVLDDATLRLVQRLVPLRIFLFGSAVRGTMSPDSDLDFLVVVPEGSDCRRLMVEAHRELRDLPVAKGCTGNDTVAAGSVSP